MNAKITGPKRDGEAGDWNIPVIGIIIIPDS
jgi:hypothetical protein